MTPGLLRWKLWAAVAVLGFWATAGNAADYGAAFARAKRCVETAVSVPLDVTLDVRAFVKRDRLPESEYGGMPVAFFDSKSRAIVIDPARCRTTLLAGAKTVREMHDVLFVLLLHELLHVYQAGVILREGGEREFDEKWLRFLCEGHAIHFSKVLAVNDGVDRVFFDRMAEAARRREGASGISHQDAEALRFRLYYVESVSFVEKRCKRTADFGELLSVARGGFKYATALGYRPADPSDRAVTLLRQCRADISSEAKIVQLDYLEAMAAVAPKMFLSPNVVSSFRGAAAAQYSHAATKQSVSIVVVLFAAPDAARKCLEAEPGERVSPSRPTTPSAADQSTGAALVGPGSRDPGQCEQVAQIGPYVVRVAIRPAGDTSPLTLPLVKRLLSDLQQDAETKP